VQHEGSSAFLRSCLRRAGDQVFRLVASTIGSTAVVAGSYVAKKILETIPEPTSVHDTSPPGPPNRAPADKSDPGARRAA
jgi:hypothetical protein